MPFWGGKKKEDESSKPADIGSGASTSSTAAPASAPAAPGAGISIRPQLGPPAPAPADSASQQQPTATGSVDVLQGLPKPSSVFEFGHAVQQGQDYMRGVCTGDDPDAIQACTWSLEPWSGKAKDKRHAYRIEF